MSKKKELRTHILDETLEIVTRWGNRKGLSRGQVIDLISDFFDKHYERTLSFQGRILSGQITIKKSD